MPDTSNPASSEAQTYDASQFERPSVTADILIFTVREKRLQVLLIQRKAWPFERLWAIPGGFVKMDEALDEAAQRELLEETGVGDVVLEQLRAYGDPGRDPRTRVITIAYLALIPSDRIVLRADTDAADARWFDVSDVPRPLAFDHDRILGDGLANVRSRLKETDIARRLMGASFTLTQLQETYETVLGKPWDKRNFRKWVQTSDLVVPTGEQSRGAHRPAALYAFVEKQGTEARYN